MSVQDRLLDISIDISEAIQYLLVKLHLYKREETFIELEDANYILLEIPKKAVLTSTGKRDKMISIGYMDWVPNKDTQKSKTLAEGMLASRHIPFSIAVFDNQIHPDSNIHTVIMDLPVSNEGDVSAIIKQLPTQIKVLYGEEASNEYIEEKNRFFRHLVEVSKYPWRTKSGLR